MKNSDNIYPYLIFSIILHLLVIYLFFFGIPHLQRNNIADHEQIITFEMLTVSDTSNVKNQQKQLGQPVQNEQAKKVQETPSIISKEKAVDILEEKKTNDHSDELVDLENKKPEVKNIEDQKSESKLKPDTISKINKIAVENRENAKQENLEDIKPRPKEVAKLEKKASKPTVPNSSDLDYLLKTLEKSSDGKEVKSDKYSRSDSANKKESKGQFNAMLSLSISEQNLIKNQIQKHWNIPAAAQNLDEVVVTIKIKLNKTGEVLEAEIVEKSCKNISPSICQILANSTERAVWQASPIVNLIADNYDKWKEVNLSFYPKEMQ
ncbi:MAG: cell envelope integrity protein TolA [Janthinobacterium lividum]